MNPEDLVGGVLRSVLGGRGKRSGRAMRYLTRDLTRGVGHVVRDTSRLARDVNRGSGGFFTRPSTLLGAVGLAWGIFESLQGTPAGGQTQQNQWAGGSAPAAGTTGDTPPPIPTATASPPIPNV